MLTRILASFGRKVLATIIRIDIGKMAGIKTKDPKAPLLMEWLTRVVVNLELCVAWILIWPCLHFGMILIGQRLTAPGHGGPLWVLLPVELIPGFGLAFAMIRMTVSFSQMYKVIAGVEAASKAGIPMPRWTQVPGTLIRLMTPSDWDFVFVIAFVALLEYVFRYERLLLAYVSVSYSSVC